VFFSLLSLELNVLLGLDFYPWSSQHFGLCEQAAWVKIERTHFGHQLMSDSSKHMFYKCKTYVLGKWKHIRTQNGNSTAENNATSHITVLWPLN